MKLTSTLLLGLITLSAYCKEFPISGTLLWTDIHPSGQFIACTTNELKIIDYANEQAYSLGHLGGTARLDFSYVKGTPFAIVNHVTETKIKLMKLLQSDLGGENYSIINLMDGKEIFNMRDSGFRGISQEKLIAELGIFILVAKKEKKDAIVAINIESGEILWDFEPEERNAIVDLLKWELVSPMAAQEGIVVIPFGKKLYGLDGVTGEKIWEDDINQPEFSHVSDDGERILLIDEKLGLSSKSIVETFHYKTGEHIHTPVELSGLLISFEVLEKGLLAATTRELYLIEPNTGELIWEEPLNLDIDNIIRVDEKENEFHMLYVNSSGYYLQRITYDGQLIWKRPAKLGNLVYHLSKEGEDFLFINDKEYNKLDHETGKQVFNKIIKMKVDEDKPLLTEKRESENELIVYNRNTLYAISTTNGEHQVIAEKIKFEGKDEFPRDLEVLENGYYIKSSQNAWLIDFDGNVIYSKYFEPPYQNEQWKANLFNFGMNMVGAAFYTSYYSSMLSAGTYFNAYRIANNYNLAGSVLGGAANYTRNSLENNTRRLEYRARLAKSQKSSSVFAALIKQKKKNTYLIQMDINSGEEINRFLLDERNPIFVPDEIGGVVYYLNDQNTFEVFEL